MAWRVRTLNLTHRFRQGWHLWRYERLPTLLGVRWIRQSCVALLLFLAVFSLLSPPSPFSRSGHDHLGAILTSDYDFQGAAERVAAVRWLAPLQSLDLPGLVRDPLTTDQSPVVDSVAVPAMASGREIGPPPRFVRPVEGRVIVPFGWREKGEERAFHSGIDFAVETGAAVVAAAPGRVESVATEPGGYGRYLILDHGAGWETLYAQNVAVMARRGDEVRAGQVIARAGHTGDADRTELHFEIRVMGKAVDPLPYLQEGSS